MKTLETLLRVKRNDMNGQRKILLDAEKKTRDILLHIQTIKVRIAQEKTYSEDHPSVAPDLSSWLEKEREEIELLQQNRKQAEEYETLCRDKLKQAWQKMKQAENALEVYQNREAEKLRLKENKDMDEIAERLYRFNRYSLKPK